MLAGVRSSDLPAADVDVVARPGIVEVAVVFIAGFVWSHSIDSAGPFRPVLVPALIGVHHSLFQEIVTQLRSGQHRSPVFPLNVKTCSVIPG